MNSLPRHSLRMLVPVLLTAAVAFGSANTQGGNTTPAANSATAMTRRAQELTSSNPLRAASAAYWLGRQGVAAAPVVPQLVAVLGDSRAVDPTLYHEEPAALLPKHSSPGQEAAAALANIGEPAVDALIHTLRTSTNAVARQNAAWALGQIGDSKKGNYKL